jgi:nitrogen fixation NifU-like protein
MNPELRELYQDLILDHGRHPRNFGGLDGYTHKLEGFNPLCGDRLTVYLKVVDGKIEAIGFEGQGCAISVASASLMTERLKGKTVDEALALFEPVHQLLMTGDLDEEESESLGKLTMLSGVSEFPTRVKCATLAWHTMKGALSGKSDGITTE